MSTTASGAIAFIGFGEAAQAFVTGWAGAGPADLRAYDIKTDGSDGVRAQKLAEYDRAGVRGCADLADALADCEVVFSMVTADQALTAAENAVQSIGQDALYFDCNSCAPTTKQKAAALIDAAGAHYVDVAVMAPVHRGLHKTPVLVSSPVHERACATMAALEMSATHAPGGIGTASSIKMVRSIMIKGLEALTLECFLSARTAGVEAEVVQSLEKSYPGFGWTTRIPYMLERAMVHGKRRAEEMREVAITVDALGLPNDMATAITAWQQRVGDLGLTPASAQANSLADQILAEREKADE